MQEFDEDLGQSTRKMTNRPWKSVVITAATVVALAVVLNPEVRAMLLVVEVLGFDMIVLLVATQARTLFPIVASSTAAMTLGACGIASALSWHAQRAFVSLLPVRFFAVLVCPLLLSFALLMQCQRKAAAS